MMAQVNTGPEFIRLVKITDIEQLVPRVVDIEANESERVLLSERFSVLSVNDFTAQIEIKKSSPYEYIAKGSLKAEVTQTCVVTLEKVVNHISTQFVQQYSTDEKIISDDLVIGPEDEQPPEIIGGGTIDLGELASEYLLLSIDPYPRLNEEDDNSYELNTKTNEENPFSSLKELLDGN